MQKLCISDNVVLSLTFSEVHGSKIFKIRLRLRQSAMRTPELSRPISWFTSVSNGPPPASKDAQVRKRLMGGGGGDSDTFFDLTMFLLNFPDIE